VSYENDYVMMRGMDTLLREGGGRRWEGEREERLFFSDLHDVAAASVGPVRDHDGAHDRG